jgi:uncharacterized protein
MRAVHGRRPINHGNNVKLHLAGTGNANIFTRYGPGYVVVNDRRFEQSLVVMPDALWTEWPATTFEALTADHLEALTGLDREVILLGTGERLRFPPAAVMRPLAGKGLEVMDVPAACRTYNILMAEGRRVAAALLLG